MVAQWSILRKVDTFQEAEVLVAVAVVLQCSDVATARRRPAINGATADSNS